MRGPTSISARHVPGTVLVTGGCGFIGSNFIRHLLSVDCSIRVINLDALTYAGRRENLSDVEADFPDRYLMVQADIADPETSNTVFQKFPIDTVVHLAAESHVDRSIDGPSVFLTTNVVGTYNLLTAAREAWGQSAGTRFHHVSTDEVFGSLGVTGSFSETTPYNPSSPYSASKAASDHFVAAWHRTYGLPITVSNCSNNYGPFQFPEKLIPLVISKARNEEALPVYGDGSNIRDWLYVGDHCSAIECVLRNAETGRSYLIGGRSELTNLNLVKRLCGILDELEPRRNGKSYADLITFVRDRPGHDLRYAIDPTRIEQDLGWVPKESIETGLRKTVEWYRANASWIEAVSDTTYRGERLGLAV